MGDIIDLNVRGHVAFVCAGSGQVTFVIVHKNVLSTIVGSVTGTRRNGLSVTLTKVVQLVWWIATAPALVSPIRGAWGLPLISMFSSFL